MEIVYEYLYIHIVKMSVGLLKNECNEYVVQFLEIEYKIAAPLHRPVVDPDSGNVTWLFSTFNQSMHIVSGNNLNMTLKYNKKV